MFGFLLSKEKRIRMEKFRVLLEDDVQNIMDGLKRMLRPMHGKWVVPYQPGMDGV